MVSLFNQSYTPKNKIQFPYNLSRQSMIILKTQTAQVLCLLFSSFPSTDGIMGIHLFTYIQLEADDIKI